MPAYSALYHLFVSKDSSPLLSMTMFHSLQNISILLLIATLFSCLLGSVYANSEFTIYARVLAANGVIYPAMNEKEYRLSEKMSRAEGVKIAMRLAGTEPSTCRGNRYDDVSAELGDLCGYIESASLSGVVSTIHPKFRFQDPMTRAELVKILLKANEVTPSKVSAGFLDTQDSLGDLGEYINAGVALGCIKASALFYPNRVSTRGEAFKIATCIMQNKKQRLSAYDGKIVWSDEFSGTGLDMSKWNTETGADGWGNKELQNYTATGNISVGSGHLIIEARKESSDGAEYSSARINTHLKAAWMYGKIEARIKLPSGQGIWPAFWMLGENIDTVGYPTSGEIDIVEMI